MRKNIKILLILLICVLLITGCELKNLKVKDPLTEEEIVSMVEKKIYNTTGDIVIAKIVSKDKQYSCAISLFNASCLYYQEKEGVFEYKIEITTPVNSEIKATATYVDSYIEYDSQETKIIDAVLKNDYVEQKYLFLVKEELESNLSQRFEKYYIYKDVSNPRGYDIFINSNDYEVLSELISSSNDIITKYSEDVSITYSLYVYKDEEAFNNTNFDLYKSSNQTFGGQSYGKDIIAEYTKKEVKRIGNSTGFDYNLFTSNAASNALEPEYVDYHSFDYLVFWYQVESNNLNGTFQVFGVK